MKNYIPSFDVFESENMDEAIKRTPDQINKTTLDGLKAQMAKNVGLMKKHPNNANVYKAQMDLIKAKMNVVTAKTKVDALKK